MTFDYKNSMGLKTCPLCNHVVELTTGETINLSCLGCNFTFTNNKHKSVDALIYAWNQERVCKK